MKIEEAEHRSGIIGRLGIGLKANVLVWGWESKVSGDVFRRDEWQEGFVRKEVNLTCLG